MKVKRSTALMLGLLLLIGFLVLYPLAMMLVGSFKGGEPGAPSPLTLSGYARAFGNPATYSVLWTTLWLTLVRTALAVVLGMFLAWVVTRTDTPGRQLLEVFVWMVFFMPLLPATMAWMLLAGPKGFINQFLMKAFGLSQPAIDIYSYGGIIWVSVIFWASIVFILVTPAFRGMDAALEESSRSSGANGFTTFRRITIPVLAPAVLGVAVLSFVRLLDSFDVELLLGYGKGIMVYSTRIWQLISLVPPDYPQSMALSIIFLAILFGLIFLQWRLLGEKQYVTVTGRGFSARATRLGRWRYVTLAVVIIYFFLGVVLPLGTLILGSFMKMWGVWVKDPLTLDNWTTTLTDPQLGISLINTVMAGVTTAMGGMLLYSFLSYIVVRSHLPGRKALDLLGWLPWGVPSLALALGFLWAYVGGIPFLSVLYGTVWLMALVWIVRGLPLGMRVMNGTLHQLGYELEDCSRVHGASWITTFQRIIAPLLTPAFVNTAIILFLIAVRDLVTVVFLYTPKSRVISVTLLNHWLEGRLEMAVVVGIIMAVIVLGVALVARRLGGASENVA